MAWVGAWGGGTRHTISLGPGGLLSVHRFPSLQVKFSETLTGLISPFSSLVFLTSREMRDPWGLLGPLAWR